MDPSQQLTKTVPPDTNSSDELVLGVDKKLIEDFLTLIRDNYKKTDEATAFLEHRARVSNVHGITNVRDVLSHLTTLLDPNTPPDKKRDQLNNAEEHLRRAILEPYEVGFSKLIQDFILVYENYRQEVEPIIDQHVALNSAPNQQIVDSHLTEIYGLAKRGRHAKGKNLWTPEWENGVANFIDAFDKLAALKSELEGYCYKYQRIRHDSEQTKELESLRGQVTVLTGQVKTEGGKSTKLHLGGYVIGAIGILLALVTFILAAALALSPTFLHWVQILFHIDA